MNLFLKTNLELFRIIQNFWKRGGVELKTVGARVSLANV